MITRFPSFHDFLLFYFSLDFLFPSFLLLLSVQILTLFPAVCPLCMSCPGEEILQASFEFYVYYPQIGLLHFLGLADDYFRINLF